MPEQQFWQGIEQFNQQEYYQCHDTLEALWMEASESDRAFYQGILQISVACYHLGNGNFRGAVILLGEGTRRLKNYQPIYSNIDVTKFITQSRELLFSLQQIDLENLDQTSIEENSKLNPQNYTLPQIVIVHDD